MNNNTTRLLEFHLGNYLAEMETLDIDDDEERAALAGKVTAFEEALNIVEFADDGKDVTDLGVGSSSVAEMRERAQEYRDNE